MQNRAVKNIFHNIYETLQSSVITDSLKILCGSLEINMLIVNSD